MNGLRYSWNRFHLQTQLLKSDSNKGLNMKTTQSQLSNRINIQKPSKSTVNVKMATETVFVLISGWTIPLKGLFAGFSYRTTCFAGMTDSVNLCVFMLFNWRLLHLLPPSSKWHVHLSSTNTETEQIWITLLAFPKRLLVQRCSTPGILKSGPFLQSLARTLIKHTWAC